MRQLLALLHRLNNLFRKRDWERDMHEEMESHLRLHTDDNLRAGIQPAEARRAAVLRLGGVEAAKEEYRDRKSLPLAENLARDLRYAFRTLRRTPAFTLVAMITLALGIGANTAMFSVVNGVLIRPLPYVDAERIVSIHDGMTEGDEPGWSACMADFLVWRSRAHSFERLAAFGFNGYNLTGEGDAEQLRGLAVTAQFFDALGARPLLGRTFAAGEDQPGRTGVALISERLWLRKFRGDSSVIGKTITLNGRPAILIGVMPATFQFEMRDADIWRILPVDLPSRRGPFYLRGLAKLKRGVTITQARTELDALGREVEAADPKQLEHARYPVRPLMEGTVSSIRPLLQVLSGAVLLVLLIAVFNVANLMMGRASARQREMAIRLSIGAGRGQLVRQLVIESLVLALAGGGAGVLLAQAGVRALRAAAPPGLPRLGEIAVDGTVLGFTVAVSIMSGVLFGLAPLLSAPLKSLSSALKEGGPGSADSPRSRRVRSVLVVAEVSLSVVLLVGAGLLIRSFDLLGRVSAGFSASPDRVLTLLLSPTSTRYADQPSLMRYWNDVIARAGRLPGVESAAVAVSVPPDRTSFTDAYEIPGRTPHDGPPPVPVPFVSAEYFRTLGIPLLRGRTFDSRDTRNSPRVTVISEAMAKQYFGAENPVGQRLKHGGPTLQNQYMEIIGVVGDVRYLGPGEPPGPVYYEAISQQTARPLWLVVRTQGLAAATLPALRATLRELDSNVPVSEAGTMAGAAHESVALPRFRSTLMTIFAAIALALAVVGIYGVVAYSVERRTQEIGIRMALGASAEKVLALVLRQGSRLAIAGIAIGLGGAAAFVRVLKTMLFGISPLDPLTFAAVAVLLAVAALAASLIPARRAARVNPIHALRHD
jgi:predicted permease